MYMSIGLKNYACVMVKPKAKWARHFNGQNKYIICIALLGSPLGYLPWDISLGIALLGSPLG